MMKPLYCLFILGAIAALIAGCKGPTQTESNGGNGQSNAPGYLYAGTYGDGIFRSTDHGLTWSRMDAGLTCDSVLAFASDSAYLFAGTLEGVFRSSDNGQSWTQVNNGLSNRFILSLLSNGTNLFAGTANDGMAGGVFRSTNDGESWSETTLSASYTYIDNIDALAEVGPYLLAGSEWVSGVFRSSDGGASWKLFLAGPGTNTLLAAVGPTLYVGEDDPAGPSLYRSDDSGASWHYVPRSPKVVSSFFASGANMLAETQSGLSHSTDTGKVWTNTSFSNGLTINTFVSDGVGIFAGTSANGVFVSTDSGATWSPANKGIDSEYVMTLAIH